MSDSKSPTVTIPFPGADEAVLAALETCIRPFHGRARRTRSGWSVKAGEPFSTNPNTLRWGARIARGDDGLVLTAAVPVTPWTRNAVARLTAIRLRQLAERLTTGPRPLSPGEDAPFGTGRTPSELCATFAGMVGSMLASMALVYAVFTFICGRVIHDQIPYLMARTEIVERSGGVPLPSRQELSAFNSLDLLGAAMLMAMPGAFFLGLVHSLVHGIGLYWRPASRLSMWVILYLAGILLLSGWQVLSPWLLVGAAIAIPAAAHAGFWLVWGWIPAHPMPAGDTPVPGKTLRYLMVAGSIALIGLLFPWIRSTDERLQTTALFRDRFLLSNPVGRAIATWYYRYTPYATEPLWETFVPESAEGNERTLRTALVVGYDYAGMYALRRHHYSIDWGLDSVWTRCWQGSTGLPRRAMERGEHDLYVVCGKQVDHVKTAAELGLAEATIYAAVETIPGLPVLTTDRLTELELHRISKNRFKAGEFRGLMGQGWIAIFYIGPVFAAIVYLGALAFPLSFLGRLSPALWKVCCLATAASILAGAAFLLYADPVRVLGRSDMKDQAKLSAALADPSPGIRHAASYFADRLLGDEKSAASPVLVAALRTAVGDPDPRVRLWACSAAGRTLDPSMKPLLIAALDDPELFVRYRAAGGLGHLDEARRRARRPLDADIVAALDRFARARTWYEGIYAVQALRSIDPENR